MEAVVTTLVGCMLVFLTIMAIYVIYRTRTGQQNQEKVKHVVTELSVHY